MLVQESDVARSRIGAMTYLATGVAIVSAEAIAALEEAIASCVASHQVQIVIDLSKTSLINSKALELILGTYGKLASLGGWLKVAYPNALIQDILVSTGLADRVPILDPAVPLLTLQARAGSKKLGDLLVQSGQISAARIAEAAVLQQQTNKRMGAILLEKKWVSEATLLKALSEQLGIPFLSMRPGVYDPEAVALVRYETACQLDVMPLFKINDVLTLATHDPHAINVFDDVKAQTGCRLRIVLGTSEEIRRIREAAYGGRGVPDFVHTLVDDLDLVQNVVVDDYNQIDQIAGTSPVINLVNAIIQRAVRDGASDIHFEVSRTVSRIRLRIDGILYEVMTPPHSLHPAIVSRLKVMANLDIAERRLPQDGRIQVTTQGRSVDLRFSSLPGMYGEKVVLRVLDKNQSILDIDRLGMNVDVTALFKRVLGRSHGLILVTGPTGSGKTTSLYGGINYLKSIEKNIVTIEDPVEYQLEIINQNQVNESIGLTFPKVLKHVLRQDPDIIMLGEVRDRETAEIAVQAALTGHLVLTTLHTNDTLGAVSRLVEMGIEPYLLSSALIAVMAQRLVRRICPSCKTTYVAPPELVNTYRWRGEGRLKLARGRGCVNCYDSGYKGRVAIYEMLEIDNELQRLILNNAGKQAMMQHLLTREHHDLYADGVMQILSGNTTPEELSRVIQDQ